MQNENHSNNEKNSTNETQDLSVLEFKIKLKREIMRLLESKMIGGKAYNYLIHYNGLNNIRIRKNNKQTKQ